MSRILISGYYGFGNAGDEAVLAAMLASLAKLAPDLRCEVLSVNPRATTEAHGIAAHHRSRPQEVVSALRRCDLFVSGGGSLLQDATSLASLLFYLAQIQLARVLRRRVMIYAQGIGPLLRPAARRLTERVLRGVDWITVRDAESASELSRIGLPPGCPPVEVTADPVFALAAAPAVWARAELFAVVGISTRANESHPVNSPSAEVALTPAASRLTWPLLGISVREWPGMETWLDGLAEVIAEVAEEIGLTPVLFPLQQAQDAPACRRLAERTGGRVLCGSYTPGEWMALAGQMHLFLGMRLHALIFAAAMGVPVVGLAYDPKVTALLARLGERPASSLPKLELDAVRRALRNTWNVREQRSVQVSEAARELARTAEVSARRVIERLDPGQTGRREPRTCSLRESRAPYPSDAGRGTWWRS